MPKDKPKPRPLPSIASLDQATGNIRLAEGGTMHYWISHGIRPETLKEHRIGWVERVGRYTIPYFDADGNLTGVHLLNPAYTEPNKDKWAWIPGSRICPWPLGGLKPNEPVVICEGESDTMRLRQMGLNALGVAGCKNLRTTEVDDLSAALYGKPAYLSFDGDQEGQVAYARARGMLKKAGVRCLRVLLPENQDVCSYLEINGEEAYLKLLAGAKETVAGYGLVTKADFQWPDIAWDKVIGDDDDDFVDLFWKWMRPASAAANAFVIYGALVCLATFMRRRLVWPRAGVGHTHGNLYVMLVAASGQYKGDVSDYVQQVVGMASDRLKARGLEGESGDYLLPKEQTPESLHKRLTEQPYGLCVWDEGGGIVGRRVAHYMNGFREAVIKLYDVPERHTRETIGKGLMEVRYPVVSVLASIQPAILERQMPDEVLVSGFLPRFCLCGAGVLQSEANWQRRQPEADDTLREDVVHWLAQINDGPLGHRSHEEPGLQLQWTDEALSLYESWVDENHELEMATNSGALSSAYRKIEKHCQKLILLFSAANCWGSTITERSVERAIACIDYQRDVVERIISSRQDTSYAEMKARVVDVLTSAKGSKVSRAFLLQRTHLSAFELDRVLDTMRQAEELRDLEVEITGGVRGNREGTHWQSKRLLKVETASAEAEEAAEAEYDDEHEAARRVREAQADVPRTERPE